MRAGNDSTLFAVGDPDQAIYAFSGAHPELLRELAREPEVHCVALERNYRCAEGIVEVSLRALGAEREITSERAGGSVTSHVVPGGEERQSAKALELVQEAVERGVDYDEIATSRRGGQDRDRCADALRVAGIPVYARTDDHWKTTSLTMLLEVLASWAAHRDAGGVSLPELLETFTAVVRGAGDHEVLRDVIAVLLHSNPAAAAHEFVESLSAAALTDYVSDPSASEDARELARMRAALAADGSAHGMTVEDLGARARAPGHVMAATIHGAKGLEFDIVVLVGADEAGLPGFSPSEEDVEEGRRKFYVSITRARDQVHLVYTDRRISRCGKTYTVAPSPFIAELGLLPDPVD